MKNKVGIVTMFGLYNYGNRLQNYAVHRYLQDLGYETETIVCIKSKVWHIASDAYRVWNTLWKNPKYLRRTAFSKFVKRTTPIRYVYSKDLRIPNSVSDDYTVFFTGSDQVWNPEIRVREKYNYFLRFAPLEKRCCISPSFGVSYIPESYVNEYSECLNGFEYLSCREAEGANLISELTGRNAEVLIDPTMMLTRVQWKQIYEPISVPKQPYILLYFLGERSEATNQLINQIANEYQLLMIDILNDSAYLNLQPDGLLQMIESSSFVCTDSFHLTAFSINFNIPFYVFDRHQKETYGNHMISRLTNLLSLFGFAERLNPKNIMNAFQCDFAYANKTLESERKKERDYLLKCLESCHTDK